MWQQNEYLLYWDITGALLCVHIGNEWNNVCNNSFNYNNLYWVIPKVIWINSDFEFQIYPVTYKILVLLSYTLSRRWDLFRGSCLQALVTGWVGPTVQRENERSLEDKIHVGRYEQYHFFSGKFQAVLSFYVWHIYTDNWDYQVKSDWKLGRIYSQAMNKVIHGLSVWLGWNSH